MNEGEWKTYPQVTAICVGNAKYFGGGMKITPNADPRSGNFEVEQFFFFCSSHYMIYSIC